MSARAGALLLAAILWTAPLHAAEIGVLFVGNSFTFVNDMPGMLAAVARSLGDRVQTDMAAPGGYTFERHARDSATRAKISARKWAFVVLQEQSQKPAFPASQLDAEVVPFALQLDRLVHTEGGSARTVFFETWGYKGGDRANCANIPETCTYDGMQSRLDAAYSDLARRTSGLLAPVGRAWRSVRLSHPEIELYDRDGIHPSPQGSYLAACVFYAVLFKKGVVGADRLGLKAVEADILQRAAQEAVFHRRS